MMSFYLAAVGGFLLGFGLGAICAVKYVLNGMIVRGYRDFKKVRDYALHLHDGEPLEGGEQ